MNENELKHYGVLGMKWGRRKGRSASIKSSKPAKKSTKLSKNERVGDLEKSMNRHRAKSAVGKTLKITGKTALTVAALPAIAVGASYCVYAWKDIFS